MTYAEHLKSLGATDEDIKILDSPLARKAFEAQAAEADRARQEGEAAKAKAKETSDNLRKWFDETAVPEYKEMERRAIAAEAEAAKGRQAWKSAQERGLVDLETVKSLGYDGDAPKPPVTPTLPAGFDPSKFVTQTDITGLADRAGDNLAAMQDLVMEHAQLFPDKPLRIRDLRREAVAAGKNVDDYWMSKYGVAAAREKRESEIKAAYEKRLKDEGAAEERGKWASQYGNPDARPLVTSNSPFTRRTESGRDKQPWERQDDPVNERVARAAEKLIKRQAELTH